MRWPRRDSAPSRRSSAARPLRATCGRTPTRAASRGSSRTWALRPCRSSWTSASAVRSTTSRPRAQGAIAELAGANAILVGSALMRAEDPAAKLRELLSRPLVKVCGLTREEDVAVAVEAGADMLGFILAEESPRRACGVLPVPDDRLSVAVFVGEAEEAGSDLVQLYEREQGRVRGRDAVLLRDGETVAQVVDLPWDEQDPLHFQRAAVVEGRVMLAGRLGPDNVREAVRALRPWAVDAGSKRGAKPGIKDHDKVRAFVEAAR